MNTSKTPKYQQIANDLKNKISRQIYSKGELIPSEATLMEEYNVSRITIRKAVSLLIEEDLLTSVQGSGTYVKKRIQHNLYELQGFGEQFPDDENDRSSKIIYFQIIQADSKIAGKLNIEEEAPVYYVRRTRYLKKMPIAVEDTYMPVQLFPDLTYEVMQGSKYAYIEKTKQLTISHSVQEFIPTFPNDEIRELLSISDDQAILKIESQGYLVTGETFEYTKVYFKSEDYSFKLVLQRHREY